MNAMRAGAEVRSRAGKAAVIGAVLLALALTWLATMPGAVHADGPTVRTLTAGSSKILADGGKTTVTVTVSGDDADAIGVTLTTTLGAFGSRGGPNRIVLALSPASRSGNANSAPFFTAKATLFGDGRRGTAAITAQAGESVRTVSVTVVGRPATLAFISPRNNDVLSADSTPRITIEARDAAGITVPGAAITLSTSAGTLTEDSVLAIDAGGDRSIPLTTATSGRTSALLRAETGNVVLTASAGTTLATLAITLHGPLVSVELIALRATVNLGDDPFPAPAGTLVAILLDDGGRPVPGTRVTFRTDRSDVTVEHTGSGESAVTDRGGRARGHVSAVNATLTGPVTVTAEADGNENSVSVRVVGAPSQLILSATPSGGGVFRLRSVVLDSEGFAIPTGFGVVWEVLDLSGDAMGLFDPIQSTVRDGLAETVLIVTGSGGDDARVRATVAGSIPPVSNTMTLPASPASGTALQPGLNRVVWNGGDVLVADAVAPVQSSVFAVWRTGLGETWQGYFPTVGVGVNFSLANGDQLYLFMAGPSALENIGIIPRPDTLSALS